MADAMFDVSNHMPSKPEKLGFWDVMKLSWAVAKIQDRWIIKRYQRRLLMGGDPEGGESGLGLGLGLGFEGLFLYTVGVLCTMDRCIRQLSYPSSIICIITSIA